MIKITLGVFFKRNRWGSRPVFGMQIEKIKWEFLGCEKQLFPSTVVATTTVESKTHCSPCWQRDKPGTSVLGSV